MKRAEPNETPDEFDLEQWISIFPLEEYTFSGCDVVGPFGVAVNEQIRQKAGGQAVLGPSIPADVFVLGKGEPKSRYSTKVGGAPFRPVHLKWPCGPQGSPLVFLVQYQFNESKDILDKLPGDILLVFTTEDALYTSKPYLHFEWYASGIRELIRGTVVISRCKNCFSIYTKKDRFSSCHGREMAL